MRRAPVTRRGLGLAPLPSLVLAPALALAALAGAGCHAPITEVVLILDSDLLIPTQTDSLQLTAVSDDAPSSPFSVNPAGTGLVEFVSFPVSVGFVSTNGDTSGFSVVVELDRVSGLAQQQIVLRRTITGIAFVKEETRMLVVPLLKVCACQGTTCPNPGNPDCDDIANPDTEPFDPSRAPPSGSPMPMITLGGPDGGIFNMPQSRPTTPFDGGSGPVPVDAPPTRVTDGGGTEDVRLQDGAAEGGAPEAGASDGALRDGNAADGGAPDGNAIDAKSADAAGGEAGAPDGGGADGGLG